jgi:hypothetical protein
VRLTADGRHFDQPFELKADPRDSPEQVQGIEQQVTFELQVRSEISKLHTAVNEIRDLREKLDTLKKWVGEDAKAKAVVDAADALDKKMGAVEEQLIQVKLKSTEGNLRYPNMLNEELATFAAFIDVADNAPTTQQQDVYKYLSQKTDEEVVKWEQIRNRDVPALNELMHRSGAPSITVE